jgi:hypothetical protein
MATNNSSNQSAAGYAVYNGAGTWFGRTITAGAGVTVTNGSGVAGNTVIAATGAGFTWQLVITTTQTIAPSNGYITDDASNVTYTLPATSLLGDEFAITGLLGLWTIDQNAGQQILFGSASTTAGTGGSLAATNVGDSVQCVCVTPGASAVWRVLNAVGNLTVT